MVQLSTATTNSSVNDVGSVILEAADVALSC